MMRRMVVAVSDILQRFATNVTLGITLGLAASVSAKAHETTSGSHVDPWSYALGWAGIYLLYGLSLALILIAPYRAIVDLEEVEGKRRDVFLSLIAWVAVPIFWLASTAAGFQVWAALDPLVVR